MNEQIEGIVLKQTEYRENDVLLSVLCQDIGRISLVGKGVLKNTSKNAAICVPYSQSLFQFDYSSLKTMFPLHTGSIIHSNWRIRENLKAIAAASVMAELIEKTTQQGEPVNHLYQELSFCLKQMHEGASVFCVLVYFIARMLEELGIDPNVDECVLCENDEISAISINEGGFVCRRCATQVQTVNVPLTSLKIFRYVNKAHQKDFVALEKACDVQQNDVQIFVDFICLHSGMKLESVQFFMDC